MEKCRHCGRELPDDSTFCPACGRRVAAEPRDVPIDVQHAEPKYFGLGPPIFVFVVSLVLLVAGIALLVAGSVALGVIAVVLALCLLPTFIAGARRWPDTTIARAGVSTADRLRDEAGAAAESITAWSRAGRDVARLRKEQFALRRERDAKVRELGVSYYAEDGRADELKAEAKELDRRLEQSEWELQRAVAAARRHTRKERAAVVSTEVIKPQEQEEAQPPPSPPAQD